MGAERANYISTHLYFPFQNAWPSTPTFPVHVVFVCTSMSPGAIRIALRLLVPSTFESPEDLAETHVRRGYLVFEGTGELIFLLRKGSHGVVNKIWNGINVLFVLCGGQRQRLEASIPRRELVRAPDASQGPVSKNTDAIAQILGLFHGVRG